MTLIAGIVAQNAIVFAADSEESGVFRKSTAEKIIAKVNTAGSSIVVSGAGHGPLIEYTAQRILKEATPFSDLPRVLEQVEIVLRDVFTNHVRLQPVSDIRSADFQLLLGIRASADSKARLYSTSGIAIIEQSKYHVCGSGSLVDYILEQTYHDPMVQEDATAACLNLLQIAKEYVDGVSGDSHIAILKDDGSYFEKPPWEVSAEENLAKEFTQITSRLQLASLRTRSGTDKDFDDALGAFNTSIKDLRERKKKSDEVIRKLFEEWKKRKAEQEAAAAAAKQSSSPQSNPEKSEPEP